MYLESLLKTFTSLDDTIGVSWGISTINCWDKCLLSIVLYSLLPLPPKLHKIIAVAIAESTPVANRDLIPYPTVEPDAADATPPVTASATGIDKPSAAKTAFFDSLQIASYCSLQRLI